MPTELLKTSPDTQHARYKYEPLVQDNQFKRALTPYEIERTLQLVELSYHPETTNVKDPIPHYVFYNGDIEKDEVFTSLSSITKDTRKYYCRLETPNEGVHSPQGLKNVISLHAYTALDAIRKGQHAAVPLTLVYNVVMSDNHVATIAMRITSLDKPNENEIMVINSLLDDDELEQAAIEGLAKALSFGQQAIAKPKVINITPDAYKDIKQSSGDEKSSSGALIATAMSVVISGDLTFAEQEAALVAHMEGLCGKDNEMKLREEFAQILPLAHPSQAGFKAKQVIDIVSTSSKLRAQPISKVEAEKAEAAAKAKKAVPPNVIIHQQIGLGTEKIRRSKAAHYIATIEGTNAPAAEKELHLTLPENLPLNKAVSANTILLTKEGIYQHNTTTPLAIDPVTKQSPDNPHQLQLYRVELVPGSAGKYILSPVPTIDLQDPTSKPTAVKSGYYIECPRGVGEEIIKNGSQQLLDSDKNDGSYFSELKFSEQKYQDALRAAISGQMLDDESLHLIDGTEIAGVYFNAEDPKQENLLLRSVQVPSNHQNEAIRGYINQNMTQVSQISKRLEVAPVKNNLLWNPQKCFDNFIQGLRNTNITFECKPINKGPEQKVNLDGIGSFTINPETGVASIGNDDYEKNPGLDLEQTSHHMFNAVGISDNGGGVNISLTNADNLTPKEKATEIGRLQIMAAQALSKGILPIFTLPSSISIKEVIEPVCAADPIANAKYLNLLARAAASSTNIVLKNAARGNIELLEAAGITVPPPLGKPRPEPKQRSFPDPLPQPNPHSMPADLDEHSEDEEESEESDNRSTSSIRSSP